MKIIKQVKKKEENVELSEFENEKTKNIEHKEQEINIEIPKQIEFFKTPVRFGNIPVEVLPIGCDKEEQYRKIYPKILLPFQIVEKISFGSKELIPNQLIFGDNLHIMRALPSNSIDLIYIDPPFFSGKNYNIIFGDQNEVRSFTDIWEGGMPGYLTWLNARLLEMKRLLKPTGSIYVHLDWHASHYVKSEMDKIFGYENFKREIIWSTEETSGFKSQAKNWIRSHDSILFYTKGKDFTFNKQYIPHKEEYIKRFKKFDSKGRRYRDDRPDKRVQYLDETQGKIMGDVWHDIMSFQQASTSSEIIGYPTQKPESLLKRIIISSTNPNDIIADFFCGGGTTPSVAQKLGRRWIASDISKIAVSVTRDRLLRNVLGENKKEVQQSLGKVPDITVANWGIYEVPKIVEMSEDNFRNFIISAYNGRLASSEGLIHGYKQSTPIFVGNTSQDKPITEKQVIEFAKHITKKTGNHQGIMIAWGFTPGAKNVAQQLVAQHSIAIDFVKIQLVPIESNEFKEHITSKHQEYKELLRFILPPEVRIITKRASSLEYEFDVSESVSLNQGSRIINVQWDFSYNGERFISTSGYSFLGMKNNKPVLKVNYKFKSSGKNKIACKVQDDSGGEKIEVMELEVK